MERIPQDTLTKLEFDKIIDRLGAACLGDLGREAARGIQPMWRLEDIRPRLEEVAEFRALEEAGKTFPLGAYEDIAEDLRQLEVEGFVLSLEALVRIRTQLAQIGQFFAFFTDDHREAFPRLFALLEGLDWDKALVGAIDRVIDEEGAVRPDASPELLRLRRAVNGKRSELDKRFRQIVGEYRQRNWLTDNAESIRNGRRVLSVPAEHKRKIRGIIHDESSTGKTAFIEPEAVIEINNDIFDLLQEEKREIHRILRSLCDTLRPWVPALGAFQDRLVRYDLVQAKGRLAGRLDASLPKLRDEPKLGIRQGYHPLLLLKNKELGKDTVPFDMEVREPNRIVVLSGPNAGGKSITLKSLGLLQLMLQAGMLIPVDEASEMGLFQGVFADIGDQQSIEDDLSTYSSHLQNMRRILEQADDRALVLIDEFGAGTDPQMGGAIAEAILRQLNDKRVWGLITTHYSNLKIFAYKTGGLVNAAMQFDKDTLSPTYRFRIGRPGSSYAYEIAQQNGLPEAVLRHARRRIGKNERAVDQLLIDLQREKQEIGERLAGLEERESKLEKLIGNYERLHRDLEFRRKKLKLEAKEKALQRSAKDNRAFERVIREIREAKNEEKAKKMAAEVREQRESLHEEVADLREEVYYKPHAREISDQQLRVGDHVRLRSGGATGTVESIDKGKAVVLVGQLRMTVRLRDVKRVGAPLEVRSSPGVQTDTLAARPDFNPEIDIRGMRMREALRVVEEFVDQAILAGAHSLKIVHGKGSGTLREAVRKKLREYDLPMEVRHPEPQEGGDGVTLVGL